VQQTINAKRGTAPKAARNRRLSKSKDAETARLARERDESLEREKAAAEVLRVISSSPGELQPVYRGYPEERNNAEIQIAFLRLSQASYRMVRLSSAR
jgi:hypothetical protein